MKHYSDHGNPDHNPALYSSDIHDPYRGPCGGSSRPPGGAEEERNLRLDIDGLRFPPSFRTRLAVSDICGRSGVPLPKYPGSTEQIIVYPFPCAVPFPLTGIIIHAPCRKIMRQQAPCTSDTRCVKNGIRDFQPARPACHGIGRKNR